MKAEAIIIFSQKLFSTVLVEVNKSYIFHFRQLLNKHGAILKIVCSNVYKISETKDITALYVILFTLCPRVNISKYCVCLNTRKGHQKNNEKNSNMKCLCENKGKCFTLYNKGALLMRGCTKQIKSVMLCSVDVTSNVTKFPVFYSIQFCLFQYKYKL